MKYVILMIMFLVLITSCKEKEQKQGNKTQLLSKEKLLQQRNNRPSALKNHKFIKEKDQKLLYGGANPDQHFDVSNLELKPENFHYGIGREQFPALLEPEFITVSQADKIWADSVRFLLAYTKNQAKAYSIKDLTIHEVVNDYLDGKPIMAVYCILADLGAIYKRGYHNQTLTFALSGYTYYDDNVFEGLDGFVLWDRETESLWWPLANKAVSGPLKGVKLHKLEQHFWKDVNWGYIKENFPETHVLKSNQRFTPPQSWDKIKDVSLIKSSIVN